MIRSVTAVMGGIGAVFGLGISAVSYITAKSAVAVRPNLADVGFVTALLTNHGGDWLFYHEPAVATVLTIVLCTFVGLVAGATS